MEVTLTDFFKSIKRSIMVNEDILVHYRPFNSIEECWQEMQKHQPFGWVKIQDTYYNINEVDSIDKKLYIGTFYYTLESAYTDITFADGSKFGVVLGTEPSETYSLYVFLPTNRPLLVKIIKEVLCLDLKEAKNLADNVCKTTGSIKNLSKKAAHELAVNINEHGGRAYIKNE